jgi:hypothetical protein
MSLLTIVQALARNVGLSEPIQIVGSPAQDWKQSLQFANETGEEIARRVEWGTLHKTTSLTGTGANASFNLPADFSRLRSGATVFSPGIVRPLTRAEWNTLAPVEGVPRYFLLEGTSIRFWPYLANGASVTVYYQSKNWTGTGSEFTADDQSPVFSEDLFEKGLIVRWRRQKGMSYQDEEAEYEATLADYAAFDVRSRF